MLDMITEQRKHLRQDVKGIFGKVQCRYDISMTNISACGATIETAKRLELNNEYMFKVKMNGDLMNLKGTVVWSRLTQKKESVDLRPIYQTGIKFIYVEHCSATYTPIQYEPITQSAFCFA